MKIKLHFNRINMQRKKMEVWTAHTSRTCEQSGLVVIKYRGVEICRTIFNPSGTQPRAYLEMHGAVRRNGRNVYIDIQPDAHAERMAQAYRDED